MKLSLYLFMWLLFVQVRNLIKTHEVTERLSAAAHLCSYAPVKPAHIGGVSEESIDPAGDQHVAPGLLILDDVVEVGAGSQHG